MLTKNHAKTGHAHKVFDKMLRASRQLLGGQNLQIIVSLDDKEGGKVSLKKTKTP